MSTKAMKLAEKLASHIGAARKFFSITKADIINEDEHIIRVKFASFGNIDSDRDLLIRGCFSKSIQERGPQSSTNRKIAFLWQHDMSDPIGKILSIEEQEDGAYAEVRLSNFDAVPNAKRAWAQLVDGDINQFSFGFSYVWDKIEYDETLDAFIVKEVKLYEISVVTMGANEQTEFIGIVSDGKALKSYLQTIYKSDKQKYEDIKSTILDALNGAEPPEALTPPETGMFEKFANLNTQKQ